ncbi:MAG TPA: hypothetical protein VM009_02995 [Terriglobales bacterium]|nr:hypothetical protein [Terriglobales bacterium]
MAKSYLYRVILPLMLAAGALQWRVAYIFFSQTQRASLATQEAARGEKVQLALLELRSSLAEVESAGRGSLLSNDPLHHQLFYSSSESARPRLKHLAGITRRSRTAAAFSGTAALGRT